MSEHDRLLTESGVYEFAHARSDINPKTVIGDRIEADIRADFRADICVPECLGGAEADTFKGISAGGSTAVRASQRAAADTLKGFSAGGSTAVRASCRGCAGLAFMSSAPPCAHSPAPPLDR
ncbi:hypothetical protein GCM10007338_12480 [Corynebacterium pelargi]|nr:hypothetical protein GCM10007338_12480 [Corynebacterium pelargi]